MHEKKQLMRRASKLCSHALVLISTRAAITLVPKSSGRPLRKKGQNVPELRISEGFKSDLLQVYSDWLLEDIYALVDSLKTMPCMGSRNLPASIRKRYGDRARKLVIDPFDIIYLYDEEHDIVEVAGLIHQRAAF